MVERKGKCENFGICPLANQRKIQCITDESLPFKCTNCNEDLKEVKDVEPHPDGGIWKKIAKFAGILALICSVGFGIYTIIKNGKDLPIATIKHATLTVQVGDTIKLTAKTDPKNDKLKWTWKSEDKSIATVSKDGAVTGVKEGSVEITATASKKNSATVTITVLPDAPPGMVFVEGEGNISGFRIANSLMTQTTWESVMGIGSNTSSPRGENIPVNNVSFNDIVGTSGNFIELNGVRYFENGFIYKYNQQTGRNYRLPTSDEWELAANRASSLGISDMIGLWQWCTDQGNLAGERALRGRQNISTKGGNFPDRRHEWNGFRLAHNQIESRSIN